LADQRDGAISRAPHLGWCFGFDGIRGPSVFTEPLNFAASAVRVARHESFGTAVAALLTDLRDRAVRGAIVSTGRLGSWASGVRTHDALTLRVAQARKLGDHQTACASGTTASSATGQVLTAGLTATNGNGDHRRWRDRSWIVGSDVRGRFYRAWGVGSDAGLGFMALAGVADVAASAVLVATHTGRGARAVSTLLADRRNWTEVGAFCRLRLRLLFRTGLVVGGVIGFAAASDGTCGDQQEEARGDATCAH
jgi:hypothetical protein